MFCTGKQLKDHLKETQEKFWNEQEKFSNKKIEIADLQICQEPDINEQAQNRKEMAKVFRKVSKENISYKKLFEEAKHCTQNVSNKDAGSKDGNLVLISGRPGIGKTTLTKRILCDMWTESLFNPDIVFFIRFRDLDYKADLNLLEFLVPPNFFDFLPKQFRNKEYRDKILEKICKSDNVYIIMDGFDEATIEETKLIRCCSMNNTNTAEGFIFNLFKGNILPRSKKLITSRPYRIAALHQEYKPDILLSIQGLDKNGFKQICSNICEGHNLRYKKILQYLKEHPDLKSYCHIPVICIMVMESLYKMFEDKTSETEDYYTLTRIFVKSLNKWLLNNMRLKSFLFKDICKFALSNFDENKFYFTKVAVEQAGVKELYFNTFLHTIIKGNKEKEMYFIHLMWQEFLAAVKLRLYTDEREFLESTNSETNKLRNNISIKLNSKEYRDVITQFLFGLCNNDTLTRLLKIIANEEGLSEKKHLEKNQKALQNFAIEKLKKLAEKFFTNRNAEKVAASPADYELDDVQNDSESDAGVDEENAAAETDNVGAINESNDNDVKQSDNGEDDDHESEISSDSDINDDQDDISDENDGNKSYFASILPIMGWFHEMRLDDCTEQAATFLLNKIEIGKHDQIFPSDIPAINYVLRARRNPLELEICHPRFVGNCTQYFIKELHETLNKNPMIEVS